MHAVRDDNNTPSKMLCLAPA